MKLARLPLVAVLAPALALAAVSYPTSKTVDHRDDYHGTKVADPYRWLEDVDSADTKAWVGAQNESTFGFLKNLAKRDAIKQRLTELINYPRYSLPRKEGGRYFYSYNTGLQNQSPLYVKDNLAAEGRLLLDPNTLAQDGTVAVANTSPSPDGRWLGYALATAGSDWNEFRVLDLATGQNTADVIKWVKFSGFSWTKDGKGFFYSRYPEPRREGNQVFSDLANQKIYYHRIGTAQATTCWSTNVPTSPNGAWAGA